MLNYNGMKCFYSDTYFTKDEFENNIEIDKYNKLKQKYDPNNLFQNLYDKCITKINLKLKNN